MFTQLQWIGCKQSIMTAAIVVVQTIVIQLHQWLPARREVIKSKNISHKKNSLPCCIHSLTQ